MEDESWSEQEEFYSWRSFCNLASSLCAQFSLFHIPVSNTHTHAQTVSVCVCVSLCLCVGGVLAAASGCGVKTTKTVRLAFAHTSQDALRPSPYPPPLRSVFSALPSFRSTDEALFQTNAYTLFTPSSVFFFISVAYLILWNAHSTLRTGMLRHCLLSYN